MELLERVRKANGNTAYFIDGKRATREAYRDAKEGKTLSCFCTVSSKNFTRHYVSAS